MISLSSSLPISPARQRALNEFNEHLMSAFELLSRGSDPELRDAIHYNLFKVKDRFCVSSALMISAELGISSSHIAPTLCALEMTRCALGTATSLLLADKKTASGFIDNKLSNESVLCLISMASELVLSPNRNPEFNDAEKLAIAQLFSTTVSPVRLFSNYHRLIRSPKKSPRQLGYKETGFTSLQELQEAKLCPTFEATGIALDLAMQARGMSSGKTSMQKFFKKLGLLTHLVEEYRPDMEDTRPSPMRIPFTQVMDILKTLESELIEEGRTLGVESAVIEIVEPVTGLFETQLQ